jgi:hypothetical protein
MSVLSAEPTWWTSRSNANQQVNGPTDPVAITMRAGPVSVRLVDIADAETVC